MHNLETEGGPANRRDFLKIVGAGATGLAIYGFWRLNYDLQTGEKLRKMNEWEPKVADFLRETLESDKLDNLKVFNEIARPQFVDLVSESKSSLLSPIKEISKPPRYDLLAFSLGEHYQENIPTYEEAPGYVDFYNDTLSFLDRAILRVGPENVKDKNLETQSNMWVEALYRSYSAAHEFDPTLKDGVYLPENQTLIGRGIAPRNRFVRLQPHS